MTVIFAAFTGSPAVGRDQSVVKMDHDVLRTLKQLQCGNVDGVDFFSAVDCEDGGVSGGLSADDCRRDHAENIPCITFAGGAASCGDQVVVTGTGQNAVGDFIQKIATLKVADHTDGVIEMPVVVLLFEGVVAINAAGRAELRHAGQGDDFAGVFRLIFDFPEEFLLTCRSRAAFLSDDRRHKDWHSRR